MSFAPTPEHLAIAVAVLAIAWKFGVLAAIRRRLVGAIVPAPVAIAITATETVLTDVEGLLAKIPLTDIIHHTLARITAADAGQAKADVAAAAIARLKTPAAPVPIIAPVAVAQPGQ